MKTIPCLTLISTASALGDLPEALASIEREDGPLFEVQTFLTHQIQDGTPVEALVLNTIRRSRAVLFDLRGNPERVVALVARAFAETAGQAVAFIPVFGGGPAVMGLLRMADFTAPAIASVAGAVPATNYRRLKQVGEGIEGLGLAGPTAEHAAHWARCVSYWSNSGADNLANLLRFVAQRYAGVDCRAAEPAVYADAGFIDVHTRRRYSSHAEYMAAHSPDPGRPTVAVLLYGGTGLTNHLAGGAELFAYLEQEANLLPFFTDGIKTTDALRTHFFQPDGRPICDAIVSLLWFRLDGGPLGGDERKTIDLLKALDVPYYAAATTSSRAVGLWRTSPDGLPPIETLATVTFPELDGAIDPVFLAGLEAPDAGRVVPVPGRGRRLAARVLRRIALARKPNADKRLAVVLFNYPPSEGTLGTASFLDVFASVEALLVRLQAAGYCVEPPAPGTLKDLFLSRGLVHNAQFIDRQCTARHALRVSRATYRRWYARLPAAIRAGAERSFGPAPGELMVSGSDLLLAAIPFGNVVVAVQPSRGVHEDPGKVHHDDSLSAHHQYIAFYRWLEEPDGWGADAVVHVGTHGTFEFLPGKQVALDEDSTMDALLGDLPHSYLYHVVNVSEGTIAKRRSYAQLVSYASPTFTPAGLYEHLIELEDLLDEYDEIRRTSPPRATLILRQIVSVADAHRVPLAFTAEMRARLEATGEGLDPEPYEAALEALHTDLFTLKRAVIPIGLHTFGHSLAGDGLLDYLNLVARYDRSETPALPRLLARRAGLDYDRLLDTADGRIESLAAEGRALICARLAGEDLPVEGDVERALDYLEQLARAVGRTDETAALLAALDGRYLEPGVGGDPVRSPHTYPTGRNTFQFDPTKLPTESACERGAAIADETLARYHGEHGTYPESVGVILWGFETCKTLGETVGQILRYIGVRPDRGQGYFIRPAVVPLADLGRPRVDVTVNICGFFRDLFPNLVRFLDHAFRAVAALDEPAELNAVRRHVLSLQSELEPDSKAAAARLFGPPPGEYGNSLSTLIETAAWQDPSDLGRMFIKRSGHLYGDGLAGEVAPGVFEAALGHTQLVSQVRDSHEFEVTDLDHYYEYFGGLATAAGLVRGTRPPVLIADTTGERIKVHTIQEAVRQGVTTRLFNPKWSDGLLAHGHQGAQQICDRVEYLIGLDATTGSVGTQIWSQVAERFVFDAAMRQRMLENNPYAEAEIAQKLAEAERRGFWQPSDVERRQLKDAYGEIENWIES